MKAIGVSTNWSYNKDIFRTVIILFPQLLFRLQACDKKLRGKTLFVHPLLFSSKTKVLDNLDFLRLIKTDLEKLKANWQHFSIENSKIEKNKFVLKCISGHFQCFEQFLFLVENCPIRTPSHPPLSGIFHYISFLF